MWVLLVNDIDLILQSQQSMLAIRKDDAAGASLTQADIKILKLVESTQRDLKNKQFHYKQLEKYSKLSEDKNTEQLIHNFINGDKSKGIKLDQRILGRIGFLMCFELLSLSIYQ